MNGYFLASHQHDIIVFVHLLADNVREQSRRSFWKAKRILWRENESAFFSLCKCWKKTTQKTSALEISKWIQVIACLPWILKSKQFKEVSPVQISVESLAGISVKSLWLHCMMESGLIHQHCEESDSTLTLVLQLLKLRGFHTFRKLRVFGLSGIYNRICFMWLVNIAHVTRVNVNDFAGFLSGCFTCPWSQFSPCLKKTKG